MPEQNKSIITKPVIITSAAIGIGLCCLTFIFQRLVFPNIVFESSERIQVEITPISGNSNSQDQISDQINKKISTETPPIPGVIALGMIVKVKGTGNEGLRMRSGAGIDQATLYLAQEDEQFKIIDGPVIIDSLIWWKIESMIEATKVGWSVQDYMKAD
ncbi:MAG: hypothetical protein MUO42_01605 [Anaerolineaceae bacterium]|nr:hypothetical protein [Anaerolineaceae bacterium]